jgi:hypothetical protein
VVGAGVSVAATSVDIMPAGSEESALAGAVVACRSLCVCAVVGEDLVAEPALVI